MSQPFEELQGWNSELKLITPISISGSHFETKKHGSHLRFFLKMSISQPFQELQGWNSEFKLITPKNITGTYFDTKLSRFGLAGSLMVAILDF